MPAHMPCCPTCANKRAGLKNNPHQGKAMGATGLRQAPRRAPPRPRMQAATPMRYGMTIGAKPVIVTQASTGGRTQATRARRAPGFLEMLGLKPQQPRGQDEWQDCVSDCGLPPAESCGDGVDNDCDGDTDCDDSDCACDCAPLGDPCTSNGDCCSDKCRGGSGRKTCR